MYRICRTAEVDGKLRYQTVDEVEDYSEAHMMVVTDPGLNYICESEQAYYRSLAPRLLGAIAASARRIEMHERKIQRIEQILGGLREAAKLLRAKPPAGWVEALLDLSAYSRDRLHVYTRDKHRDEGRWQMIQDFDADDARQRRGDLALLDRIAPGVSQ